MKRLNEIIKCKYDIPIKGIKTDSRKIQEGDLFVAVKGFNVDHHLYIKDAIDRGAVAVIGSIDIQDMGIPYIKVDDTNKTLGKMLSKFYDYVEKKFRFIGITGTDGKTTTAVIVSKILDCCYIGTNGVCYKNYKWSTSNTTPDVCELYEILDKLNNLGCEVIAMEVSSEALLHGRVDNLNFEIVCLTNIFEDHLNIHKSIDNYIEAKKKLFSLVLKDGFSILNRDDSNYFNVKNCCINNVYSYGEDTSASFKVKNVNCQRNSTDFDVDFLGNCYHISSKLIGKYNVYNLTLAFAIAYFSGIDTNVIISKIKDIDFVSGRGERLDFGQDYTIILDYAHTYNGIYNIISNLKQFSYSKIIVVTGAAGGREKEKRKKIGNLLLLEADYVIFTMDDPRYEKVDSIIDDLVSDTKFTNYERVIDRESAILKAFRLASTNDLVLILGKGRDNYMAIFDKKVKYCDYDVISNYFMR